MEIPLSQTLITGPNNELTSHCPLDKSENLLNFTTLNIIKLTKHTNQIK